MGFESAGLVTARHAERREAPRQRRAVATYSARAGTPRVVVGKILGHADADVTGRYDAHAYDREKRDALAKWAADLLRIVAGKKQAKQSKVLPWASSARM